MLELAAGTGDKTLSGLGTSFANFETVIFDADFRLGGGARRPGGPYRDDLGVREGHHPRSHRHGGGHFLVSGALRPTGRDIYVDAADLAKTTYQSGSGTDTLWVRADDGNRLGDWSSSVTVTPISNTLTINQGRQGDMPRPSLTGEDRRTPVRQH